MGIKEAILATTPTSYWPLDDASGTACHDERGLHEASLSGGVKLAVVPFGQASAPYFDGEIGSNLTIVDDERYSQPHANALSLAAWICPLTLNNTHKAGGFRQRSVRAFHGEIDRHNQRRRVGDAIL